MTEEKIDKVLDLCEQNKMLNDIQVFIKDNEYKDWNIVVLLQQADEDSPVFPEILRVELEKAVQRCIESINKELKEL